MEKKHVTEYEVEALRTQEQMSKAEARVKVFEMMDQQSTKSEADLMKKGGTPQSSQEQQKEIFVMIYFISNINNTSTIKGVIQSVFQISHCFWVHKTQSPYFFRTTKTFL